MNLVTLAKLNELRFPHNPVAETKLWRWCREGKLPARKIGGEWFVDLDVFDAPPSPEPPSGAARVLDKLRLVR